MPLAVRAVLLLSAAQLCACLSVDMNGMDETFHNTPEKQAAAIQAQNDREAKQEALDDYYSRFGGKSPYDYYRSQGYSERDAQKLADKAQPPP